MLRGLLWLAGALAPTHEHARGASSAMESPAMPFPARSFSRALRVVAVLFGAWVCDACTQRSARSVDAREGDVLVLSVVTPDGAPCPFAEVYLEERFETGLRWSSASCDERGLCVRHPRWHPWRAERAAAWHPAHGLSHIRSVPTGSRVELVLDRPLHVMEGRCLTRAGHPPGRIAIAVDARKSGAAELPRIEEEVLGPLSAVTLLGYAPRTSFGSEAWEEALLHGFEERLVASAVDGRFRCAGLRRPARSSFAHVAPTFELDRGESSRAVLDRASARRGTDGLSTWSLPWERVRWEIAETEKTHVEDAGTWLVRDAQEGAGTWVGRGEQQELWTSRRALRFFYARRPWTYVDETVALDQPSAEILRFEPLPQERLARVDLRSSALTLEVDVRYAMGDGSISLREDHGLLRFAGGEPLWVFPTSSRLFLRLDPLNDRRHACSSSSRWLDLEREIDPALGQAITLDLPQREGARVRVDLDALREPERRLAGLRINGTAPTWMYVDRRGQVRELASSAHRHGRIFTCELFEPGRAVVHHDQEPWLREVTLAPGPNDLRIE